MRLIFSFLFLVCALHLTAQTRNTEKLVIVTLDGFRWQELFNGVNADYLSFPDTSLNLFLHQEPAVARKALMPFIWTTIARKGQLYGNRNHGNKVNLRNNRLISYPGYNEMLVGFPSLRVFSNRKVENPFATVLEKLHQEHGAHVATFSTWDAFPYILRANESGVVVNDGHHFKDGEVGMEADSLTFRMSMAYLTNERPDVIMIAFDATDHYAHRRDYKGYIQAAHTTDAMLKELWEWLQSQPDYADKTTLFITTDHGRGVKPETWHKHRLFTRGSRHAWFVVVGPDTPSRGELTERSHLSLDQTARTLAAFLGYDYKNVRRVGDVIATMLSDDQDVTLPVSGGY